MPTGVTGPIPLLLQRQHGLDKVERISVEVLGEPGVGHTLSLFHSQLLREHLTNASLDLRTIHDLPPASSAISGPDERIRRMGFATTP